MNTTPRNFPRFVPTLTEIVEPSSLVGAPPLNNPDSNEIVQSVMQRVDEVLEYRLREHADVMLRNLVTEQLGIMHLRLRSELELVVQKAVAQAMVLQEDEH